MKICEKKKEEKIVTKALLVAKPLMRLLSISKEKVESPCYGRDFNSTNQLHLEQKKIRMIIWDALTNPNGSK